MSAESEGSDSAYKPWMFDAVVSKVALLQRGAFQPDLFTGSASYFFEVEVPPGTNGLTPRVVISYNSQSALGRSSWLGLGWSLNDNYIQRDVNYTVDKTSDDEFDLILDGKKYDLVYNGSDGLFRTKIDSFMRVVNNSGGLNQKGVYWTVTTKDGTEYRFGYSNNSEALSSVRDYAWRWSLDQVTDTHGNKVYYTYNETPVSGEEGTIYLSRIDYNTDKNRTILFNLEDSNKPDYITVYSQGSRITELRRLKEILVYANGSLVRRIALSYHISNLTNRSLLSSITEYSSDNTTSLPPVRFTYQKARENWVHVNDFKTPEFFTTTAESYDHGFQLVDLNRDGLVDIMQSFLSGSEERHVWLNNGSGWVEDSRWTPPCIFQAGQSDNGARLADVNGDGLVDIIWAVAYPGYPSNRTTWLNNGSGWVVNSTYNAPVDFICSGSCGSNGDTGARLVDLNGDGLVDVVVSDGGGGSGSIENKTWINNGHGWTRDYNWSMPELFNGFEGSVTRFADVNGDGLVDLLKSVRYYDYGGGIFVNRTYINNGSAFVFNGNWSIPDYFLRDGGDYTDDTGLRIVDVNADGLPDLTEYSQQRTENKTWINTGHGWREEREWQPTVMIMATPNLDKGVRFLDVDGNGIDDTLRSEYNYFGGCCKDVWLNNVTIPDLLVGVNNSLGGSLEVTYEPSTRYNSTRSDNLGYLASSYWLLNTSSEDNGMSGAHNLKATTRYYYRGGFFDYKEREFRGFNYVKVTNPDGTYTEHYFHQNDSLKGREYNTTVKDAAGSPYSGAEYNWTYTQIGNRYVVELEGTRGYTFDGSLSSPKVRQTRFQYDAYGNVIKESRLGDPTASGDEKYKYTEYVYNTSAWILGKPNHTYAYYGADSNSSKASESWFRYDGLAANQPPVKGDLTRKEDWLDTGSNPVTTYGYDTYGNIINMTDANGGVTKRGYDSTFTYAVNETNPLGQVTRYAYDLGLGKIKSKTDANGYTTSYEYDALGRTTKEIRPYDSTSYPTVAYSYDVDGAAPEKVNISMRETAGSSDSLDELDFFDGYGRLIQVRKDAEDSSQQVVINVYYDNSSRVREQSNPYLASRSSSYSNTAVVNSTRLAYDPAGRLVNITNPDNTVKKQSFDHWTTTAYDENGDRKDYTVDAYGRVTQVVEYNSGEQYTTKYAYDGLDNLVNITDDAGNKFKFEFDSLGRKIRLVDPDLGTWTYGYDAVGNLMNQTDNRSKTIKLYYDSLNRLLVKQTPTEGNSSFTYDVVNGTLSRIVSPVFNVSFTYDQRLRKTSENKTVGGRNVVFNWSYDSMDRITQEVTPNGTFTSTYNSQGLLDLISSIVSALDYNALGKATFKRYQNNVNTSYTYRNDNYRLTQINSPSILDLRYGYDAVGNIVSLNDSVTGSNVSYGYDDLNRLTSASELGGFSQRWVYSSIGNILSVAGSQNTAYYYGSNAGPHAVTSLWFTDKDLCKTGDDFTVSGFIETIPECGTTDRAFTYDDNGNMLSDGFFTFEYDDANMLSQVKNATTNTSLEEYEYDHTGNHILKTVYSTTNATTYYYSKEYEETVYSNGTTTQSLFIFANNERVAEIRDGVAYYYLSDHLGSTSIVLNESGGVVDRITYYPYGLVKTRSGNATKYAYNSNELNSFTERVDYGPRQYNPWLMRFDQPDNLVKNLYDPQNLNRYSYVLNNPLKYTDPSGNQAQIAYAALEYVIPAISDFALYMSESWFAFGFFESTETAYEEAGLEGVAVNTAGWVLGPKIIGSVGGRVANTAARLGFVRELSAAVKEASPGLYKSLTEAKTVVKTSDFKYGLAKEGTLAEEVTVGRYFGGEAFQESPWFTTLGTDSSVLNLPTGNAATDFVEATLPKGTKVEIGFTESGGLQVHIPDVEWEKVKGSIKWGTPTKVSGG